MIYFLLRSGICLLVDGNIREIAKRQSLASENRKRDELGKWGDGLSHRCYLDIGYD